MPLTLTFSRPRRKGPTVTDAEIEAAARGYAGADFRERRRVIVEPILEYSSEEWSLDEFLGLLQKIKTEMPADASNAKVAFEGGWGEESGKFHVSYETWETEAEVAERVCGALKYAQERARKDRREYERLKAKFEANS